MKAALTSHHFWHAVTILCETVIFKERDFIIYFSELNSKRWNYIMLGSCLLFLWSLKSRSPIRKISCSIMHTGTLFQHNVSRFMKMVFEWFFQFSYWTHCTLSYTQTTFSPFQKKKKKELTFFYLIYQMIFYAIILLIWIERQMFWGYMIVHQWTLQQFSYGRLVSISYKS